MQKGTGTEGAARFVPEIFAIEGNKLCRDSSIGIIGKFWPKIGEFLRKCQSEYLKGGYRTGGTAQAKLREERKAEKVSEEDEQDHNEQHDDFDHDKEEDPMNDMWDGSIPRSEC